MTASSIANSSTSRGLLERARAHDPQAWERMSALYGPLVYQWCRRAGLQASDAADVVQEVFRAVAKSLGQFQSAATTGSFRAWLWVIVRNKLRDHQRRQARQPRATGGTSVQIDLQQLPEAAPDDTSADGHPLGRSALARRALALMQTDFEERTWQAFCKLVIEEKTAPQVAQELGLSTSSVYVAKSRVLRRLRQELDGLETIE